VSDYQKYGAFNTYYIPINFYYQYIHYPIISIVKLDTDVYMGGSLFLLSPVFFFAFRAVYREWRNLNIWILSFAILATSIPILLLMGTGWVQYGPRYTFDFTVPLLMLTAFGIPKISKRLLTWLIVFSVIHYIPGIILFAYYQL